MNQARLVVVARSLNGVPAAPTRLNVAVSLAELRHFVFGELRCKDHV